MNYKQQLEDHDYDQEDRVLKNGAVNSESRHCTDCFCALLFIVCLGMSVFIAQDSYKTGDPYRLGYPYDPDSNGCGVSPGYEHYPFIYWSQPLFNLEDTVCVKHCPKTMKDTVQCKVNSRTTSCVDPTPGIPWVTNHVNRLQVYPTVPLYGRVCMPQELQAFENIAKEKGVDADLYREYLGDLYDVRWVILYCSLIAVGLSIAFLVLLRYCAGVMVWLVLALYLVMLACGTYVCYQYYNGNKLMDKYKHLYPKGANQIMNSQTGTHVATAKGHTVANEQNIKDGYKAMTITLFVVFLVSILVILCSIKKIQLVIGVLKTAASFIADTWEVMFVPLIFYVLTVLTFLYMVVTYLYLYSSGTQSKTNKLPFAQFHHSDHDVFRQLFFIFDGLWVIFTLQALQYFVVASAVCTWYFNQGQPEGLQKSPLGHGFYNGLVYHLGSLAFGSFLLTVCWLLLQVLSLISKVAKETGDEKSSKVANACSCCVGCFENCLHYITEAAYTRMALTGTNFCTSAFGAFQVISTNPLRYNLVEGLGGIFVAIGKMSVSMTTAYLGYEIINRQGLRNQLVGYWFPCLVFGFIAYIVADVFLKVYDIATEAILQCFLLDEKVSEARNYHDNKRCPEPLRAFFDQHETAQQYHQVKQNNNQSQGGKDQYGNQMW